MGGSGQAPMGWHPSERGGEPSHPHWWQGLRRVVPVIWDRRLGERRHQPTGVGPERRRGERRRPFRQDLGAVTTYLGVGSRWQGALHFRGVLRIDGDLQGPGVRGGILIIGESARVQAPIDVDLLQVGGQVQGEIRARQWVELRARSRVRGLIWAPRVELWPGAVFQGTVHLEGGLAAARAFLQAAQGGPPPA